MAVTATPAYCQGMAAAFGAIDTANTAMDGTGTVQLIATAGANGAIIDTIFAKSKGTCVASVARFFLNNGAAPTTATNNALILELDLAATTASNSASNTGYIETRLKGICIPATYRLYVTIGTTVVGGWMFCAIIKNL